MFHFLHGGSDVENRRNHCKAVERVAQHGAVRKGNQRNGKQHFDFGNETNHEVVFFACKRNQSEIQKNRKNIKRNQKAVVENNEKDSGYGVYKSKRGKNISKFSAIGKYLFSSGKAGYIVIDSFKKLHYEQFSEK